MTADSSIRPTTSASAINNNATSSAAPLQRRGRRILVSVICLTSPLLVSFIYFVWMPGTFIGKTA